MAETPMEFWIKIIQVVIILIILSYFIYRRVKDRITGFSWFILLFSMALTQAIVEISIFFPKQNGVIDVASDINEIHIIPYAIGLFGLFLYCESILHSKPNPIRFGIACALFGAYLATYFVQLGFWFQGMQLELKAPEYRIYRVIFNVFQAFVLAEALYMFIQDYLKVEYEKLRRISLIISITLGIAFIFSLFKIFEFWFLNAVGIGTDASSPINILFYGAIPFGILFGVLAIEFIANPFYVYLLPARINKVIIIDESGLLLYAVRVGLEMPDIVEHTLLSGTLSAMKQLLKETTGTKSDLKKISFRDKHLIIAENELTNVSSIIISDSDSFMLQTAADQFIDEFCTKFAPQLNQFDGSVECFDEATELVRRIFPFVPPSELVREDDKSAQDGV